MEIRRMFATDLKRGFLETLAALSPVNLTPDEAVAIFQRRLREKTRTYVALIDDRVVGTASLLIEQKYLHGGGIVGHIEDVSVHADFQGHQIGSQLVQHLIAEGRQLGCYKLILDARPELVEFYQRAGFREWVPSLRLDLK